LTFGGGQGRLRAALLIALVPGIVGILLTYWPPVAGLESAGLDYLFLLRGQRAQPQDVCVVAIDDESYAAWEVDKRSTWPRGLHGELIRTLHREGARAIAFDVLFEEAGDPAQDEMFLEALTETGIVVLGATVEQIADPKFRSTHRRDPFGPFAEAAADVAEVNLPTDRDGVIRTTWPFHGDRPSLALAAYEMATGDYWQRVEQARLIDYFGPPRTVPTVSLYQALDPATYLPDGYFKDRVVFVGLSEVAAAGQAAKDSFLTPYRGGHGATTYGVEIHATIAANLLEDRQIRILPGWLEAIMLLLVPTVGSLLFMYLRPVLGGVALLVMELVPWVLAYGFFVGQQLWLPVVVPSLIQLPLAYLISLLWYYLTTRRDRERIRLAFGHYLSPTMISKISENPDSLHLGGEEIIATALFSDIKGFTSIAEGMSAEETAEMLNIYFTEITRHIFEAEGTLIKFIGDAVFAIWGAPIETEQHANLACRTAVAMSRSREKLQGTTAGKLITRIGVHTGPMLVGNLGSTQRFDYTAIGDAVNLAARLEGLNKAFGTDVMASSDSFLATDGSVVGRPLGRVRVVGRRDPVKIHQLLSVDETPAPADQIALDRFQEALQDYEARRFDEAAAKWTDVLQHHDGHDGASEFYLREIDRLRGESLPDDWDGVITSVQK
jgi:adenylate cyclase